MRGTFAVSRVAILPLCCLAIVASDGRAAAQRDPNIQQRLEQTFPTPSAEKLIVPGHDSGHPSAKKPRRKAAPKKPPVRPSSE